MNTLNEPENPLILPTKTSKSIGGEEENRNNNNAAPKVNKIEIDDNDKIDIRTIDVLNVDIPKIDEMESRKGNAPVQTCLEMAQEGIMTPLPGVNCIHTLRKNVIAKTTTEKTTTTTGISIKSIMLMVPKS